MELLHEPADHTDRADPGSPACLQGTVRRDRALQPEPNRSHSHLGKHSLGGFEATPIAESAEKFDLIILDHPFMGDAAKGGALVNLLDYSNVFDFPNLAESYVGPRYASYAYGGGVWALPINGACQTAVARPDLTGRQLPKTFDDVLALGKQGGLGLSMAVPHAFMNFLAIAGRQGADLSGVEERFLPHQVAVSALHILRQMAQLIPEEAFEWSSIDLLEAMATTDDIKYCPMVFCFNSYAQHPRDGRHLLRFSSLPGMTVAQDPGGSVGGGAGLAISSASAHREAALRVAAHLVGEEAQVRIGQDGGQPAHKSVWQEGATVSINGTFFDECRADMKTAVLRPRYSGYMALQNSLGDLLKRDAMRQDRPAETVIHEIEELFQASKSSREARVRR
jgi:multiple sugar transport system substrate-binding protein